MSQQENSVQAVRTFYSRASALVCWATPPQRVFGDNGMSQVIEGKQVAFTPQADGFGRFVTHDPDIIKYLEWRATEVGDVMEGDRYQELTTPLDVQNQQLKRVIFENNRLIETLRAQLSDQQGKQSSPKK